MAKLRAVRKSELETIGPVNIGDRAIGNLAFIRETMERSTHFTAVPAYGRMLMGLETYWDRVGSRAANARATHHNEIHERSKLVGIQFRRRRGFVTRHGTRERNCASGSKKIYRLAICGAILLGLFFV